MGKLLAALGMVGVLLVGAYATRHEYQVLNVGDYEVMMRTNRYTGTVEKRTSQGWKQVSPMPRAKATTPLPPCTPAEKERAKTNPSIAVFICNPNS